MKLLFCTVCGDIIAPFNKNMEPRWCACGRHAIWWIDGDHGILRPHDREGPTEAGPANYNTRAYVIGLSNSFLTWQGTINADVVRLLNDMMPDTYLFKRIGSPVIRVRPGETSDTGWASLPT